MMRSIVTVVVVVSMMLVGETTVAQDLSCAAGLIVCKQFLNTTASPSTDCCDAMKDALKTKLPCLCGLLKIPDILKQFNVNTDEINLLAKKCSINETVSVCNSITNSTSTPSPSGPGTKATPNPPPNQDGAASIAWMGMSGLVTLFLFFWSIVG